MMPFLFDSQAEDVSFAEKRFEVGKGRINNNGETKQPKKVITVAEYAKKLLKQKK